MCMWGVSYMFVEATGQSKVSLRDITKLLWVRVTH